jgi:hypothetical protein
MPFLPTRSDIQISYEQWLNSEGFTRDRDDEITNNPLEAEPFVINWQEFETTDTDVPELEPGEGEDELGLDEGELGLDEHEYGPGSDEDEPGSDEDEPGSDEDEPGSDDDEPGSDDDEPGSDDDDGSDDDEEPGPDEPDSEDETNSVASEILRDSLALYYMAHSVIESIQYEESDAE